MLGSRLVWCWLVAVLILTPLSGVAQCTERWFVGIGQPGIIATSSPAIEGPVYASVVWDRDGNGPQTPLLVVGGDFHPGVGSSFNRLAAWDGATWQDIGGGVTGGPVRALHVENNQLIVGGKFTHAGGVPASYVARWDGISWHAMGTGISGIYNESGVYTFASYAGWLVAGGNFNMAGTTAVRDLAKWDGASWTPLGPVPASYSGNYMYVKDMRIYNGSLILAVNPIYFAGGVFRYDFATNSLVRLGIPSNQYVSANSLSIFEGDLIAAGHFTQIGTAAVQKIARWNGSTWQAMGSEWSGSASPIYDTIVHNDKLYAVGFHYGLTHAAQWSNGTWIPLGSGLGITAYTGKSFNGDLVVGGNFLTAGSQTARRVANWGCGGAELLDPNPLLNGVNRVDSNDANPADQIIDWSTGAMSSANKYITKAATDGVTRVLVRWRVTGTGPVTLSLSDENGGTSSVGTIGVPGAPPTSTSVTVSSVVVGSRRYAFAEYLVPNNFVRTSADDSLEYRPVRITGVVGTTTISTTLKLIRPPVLLVHGLASEAAAWDLNIQKDSRFIVFPAQYRSTNQSSFHTNREVVLRAMRSLLSMTRAKGIAATQAMLVGHSLGGLLARIHASNQYGWYYRRGNLGQGDFYKYISVYTPHEGSGIACAAERLYANPIGQAAIDWRGFCVNCGAISDLRPDSLAISSMPAMPNVPSHALVGLGGAPLLAIAVNSFNTLGVWYRLVTLVANLIEYLQLTAVDTFSSFNHDLVVADISARGGLPLSQISNMTLLHYGWASTHTGATDSSYLNDYTLLGLLNEPLPSPRFASGLLANTSYPNPQVCQPGYQFPTIQLEPPTSSRRIRVRSPRGGANVPAGSTIELVVDSSGGFQIRAMAIEVDDIGAVVSKGMRSKILIPDDAVGPYTVSASAIDPLNKVAIAKDVVINVTSSAVLQSIEALTPWVEVGAVNDTYQLSVFGNFSSSIRRDLSLGAKGTTYVSTNPAIVTVSPDGLLIAVAPGTADIEISNGGFDTVVTAVVRQ